MQETWERWVRSLDREDTLEEGTATHSSILAWRIPWTEKPGSLWSLGSQRVRYDWSNLVHTHGYRVRVSQTKVSQTRCLNTKVGTHLNRMTDEVGGYLWPNRMKAFVFLLCFTCTDRIKCHVCVHWLYCDKTNRSFNKSFKFCPLHTTMPHTIFPGFVAWLTADLILYFFFLIRIDNNAI